MSSAEGNMLFPRDFLQSRGKLPRSVVTPMRRPRTLSPMEVLRQTEGEHLSHFQDALKLTKSIAERLAKQGYEFNADDRQQLSDISVVVNKRSAINRSSTLGGSLSQSIERPVTPAERKTGLLGKLKQASAAAFVYKEMAESKEDLSRLTSFSIECSAAALDEEELAKLVRDQFSSLFSLPNIEVLTLNPSGSLEDPLSGRVVDLRGRNPEATSKTTTTPFAAKNDAMLPLHAQAEGGNSYAGVIRVIDGALVLEQHRKAVETITPIAALALRNLYLHKSVKWQVEKAEAMLKMANQLSRDNLDERVLAQSIMQTAKQLTESDRCSIFLVNGPSLQAYFEDGKTVNISIDTGIAGHVAKTGEVVNIKDAYEDARFNSSVDKATGYRTKTILCMPVTYEGTIVAVAQLINKKPQQSAKGSVERAFTERDEELFHTFSTFAGVSLRNCRINANLVREKKKSEAVLDVVQLLSETDIRDVNGIVSHVMLGAKKLLNADRSSLFLFDKERDELYSKVADSTGGKEIRFKSGLGIAGTVASSGVAENIADAYEDDRFNRDVDKAFNYRTRSILCEPIMRKGDVIAVAQLVNRLEDDSGEVTTFTADDQLTFRTFAMFAGISISNSHLLEFAVKAGQEAMALNEKREAGPMKRTNSTVSALVPVSDEELERVRSAPLAESALQVTSRDYDFFEVREGRDALEVGVQVAFRVIWSTGLPEKFKCPEDTLYKFIVQCRRRYRSVPYHNFFHAVDVCQTVHTFLYEGKAAQYLTDLECFVLLVTALVHDLDHMGVNNSFHMKTDSPLGILSSASGNNSVLEVHHCNLAIEILEDKRSNVFCGLDSAEVKQAYRGMIDCVLSTDMARHGDLSTTFSEMETINKEDEQDRRLVMEMVLKAADISNVTKPFAISKKWAMCVTEEFYQQGDKEKERGVAVLPMFDRKANNELAKGQIGFISFLAEKFFAIVAKNITGLQWTVDNIESNKRMWEQVLEARRRSTISQAMSQ